VRADDAASTDLLRLQSAAKAAEQTVTANTLRVAAARDAAEHVAVRATRMMCQGWIGCVTANQDFTHASARNARAQTALELRDIRVGPPLFGGRFHKPWLDDDGRLNWRMVLVYPESDQSDLVRTRCGVT
jgi:hypothetical protein